MNATKTTSTPVYTKWKITDDKYDWKVLAYVSQFPHGLQCMMCGTKICEHVHAVILEIEAQRRDGGQADFLETLT